MAKNIKSILTEDFEISAEALEYVNEVEKSIIDKFYKIDKVREFNQYKIIKAMQEKKLVASDFNWTTGYGYGDVGRDKVEEIYSYVFGGEDALVRPTIASGTHALFLTLSGVLRPGDHLLSFTGAPYDTLQQVIGSRGEEPGSLKEFGISYSEVQLKENKTIDIEEGLKKIQDNTKLVMIQRSTGYSSRKAFTIDEIEEAIEAIKSKHPGVIIMVDNCYGEFTSYKEPSQVGADLTVGSLIKNPGGGLALSGGYIVGKKDLIELISNRLTAPGLGKDCGLTFGTSRSTMQGLFLAPNTVSQALKGAILVGASYKGLGFEIVPDLEDERSDIIQAIKFADMDKVNSFCRGIQSASAVDYYYTPEAWDMPGYEDKVIMAAGCFIEGSSIELSADGPMREPYYAYFQGGLTYDHCKLGLLKSLSNLLKEGLINPELLKSYKKI